MFYKKQPTYNPQMEIRGEPRKKGGYIKVNGSDNYGSYENAISLNNEYYPTNLLEFSNSNRKEKMHPTQKPIDLFEYLIKTYTNEGDIVLDNYIGSGTTAVAAINTGRNFIGIEKNEEYYNLCISRVEKALINESDQKNIEKRR